MKFDVIIIGGGAAGISAALWCDELGLSALVLEEQAELGGQLLWTHNEIKNHLGIEAKNGRELRDIFLKQIERRRFEKRFGAKVSEVDLTEKSVFLESGENFSAQSIIVASGILRRKLNVEGELKFQNKGIITSGKRDAEHRKGENVLIVGGGDAAFENALILAENSKSVTLAYRGTDFRARAEFVERVKENPKINILTETIVRQIIGKNRVEAVELEDLKLKVSKKLSFEVLLIRIGVQPNTEFLLGKVELDKNGYIKINENCETSAKDVFAIGDAANPLAPTISSAIGMGATAVKSIKN